MRPLLIWLLIGVSSKLTKLSSHSLHKIGMRLPKTGVSFYGVHLYIVYAGVPSIIRY